MGTRRIKGVKGRRISPETREVLERQLAKFRQKFGREPGPGDPIFFDEDADTPQFHSQEHVDKFFDDTIQAMSRAGTRPEFIYAFRKTGRIVTEKNAQYLTPTEIGEWESAIKEYFEKEKQQRS